MHNLVFPHLFLLLISRAQSVPISASLRLSLSLLPLLSFFPPFYTPFRPFPLIPSTYVIRVMLVACPKFFSFCLFFYWNKVDDGWVVGDG